MNVHGTDVPCPCAPQVRRGSRDHGPHGVRCHNRGRQCRAGEGNARPAGTGRSECVVEQRELRGTRRATGDFAGRATRLCAQARRKTALLRRLDRPNTRLCSQIYSGPEHARIAGTVDGTSVNITIARSDGCGTADWQQLQWLLGPPVR